jgi:hypothetical protein
VLQVNFSHLRQSAMLSPRSEVKLNLSLWHDALGHQSPLRVFMIAFTTLTISSRSNGWALSQMDQIAYLKVALRSALQL